MAVYLARAVLPLLLRRINPLYAAYTIERSRPALKNGLLNFLFFRADPGGMSQAVYQAIEEQAATNLAKVHVEAAVDRSKLIQIGYVLVGIILACAALYVVLAQGLVQDRPVESSCPGPTSGAHADQHRRARAGQRAGLSRSADDGQSEDRGAFQRRQGHAAVHHGRPANGRSGHRDDPAARRL